MDILRITKPDRRWSEIVIWWEMRRIPFNLLMYLIGLASFYIGYVTIPLFYLIIGLLINLGYTFCWVIELIIIRRQDEAIRMKYARVAFLCYLTISSGLVFGFAFFLFL
jgi:hypothetical protein